MLSIRQSLICVIFAAISTAVLGQEPAISPAKTSDSVVALGAIDAGMDADLAAGFQAIQDQKWGDAVKLLEAYIAVNPEHIQALTNLAYAHEKLAEKVKANTADPQANERLTQAINRVVELYRKAASLADRTGEKRTAEQLYGRVLLYQPGNLDALLGQGRILATDRPLQAADRYIRYLKSPRGQKDAQAHLELARLYLANKYAYKSLEVLEEAVKISPDNPEVQIELARAYGTANQMEPAIVAANRALEKSPNDPNYHATLAGLLLKQNKLVKATEEAQLAIQNTRNVIKSESVDTQRLVDLSRFFDLYRQTLEAQLAERADQVPLRMELARAIREQAATAYLIGIQSAIKALRDAPASVQQQPEIRDELARLQDRFNRELGEENPSK